MIQIILLDNGIRVANIDYPNNHLVFGIERTNIIEIFDSGKKVVSAPYTEFINELGQPFLTPESVITTLELSYLNLVSQEELDVETADRIAADTVLSNRTTILENNEYKITYYEVISGASGSLTVPSQATINADEFGLSGNAILSKIDGSNKPTFQSPTTSGGVVVAASLNTTTGAWTASGTYTDANVALIYSIKIKAVNYGNLTYSNIIETVKLNDITKYSYIDTSLGTLSSTNSLTLSKSVLTPANTLTSGLLNIKGRSIKTGTGSFGWLNIYVNTSNSMSGAIQLGQMNNASNNTILSWAIERNIPIQSGSFTAFIVNGISGSENVITNTVSTVTIDWTVDQYIILAVQANNGAESLRANFLSVNQF